MIGILILIAIAVGFSNYAKKHGLHRILWGFLGVVGYYGGSFFAGMVIALISPEVLDSMGNLIIAAILGGIVGVAAMFLLMRSIAINKKRQTPDSDLIDSQGNL